MKLCSEILQLRKFLQGIRTIISDVSDDVTFPFSGLLRERLFDCMGDRYSFSDLAMNKSRSTEGHQLNNCEYLMHILGFKVIQLLVLEKNLKKLVTPTHGCFTCNSLRKHTHVIYSNFSQM